MKIMIDIAVKMLEIFSYLIKINPGSSLGLCSLSKVFSL